MKKELTSHTKYSTHILTNQKSQNIEAYRIFIKHFIIYITDIIYLVTKSGPKVKN